ncbi:MAG: PAS domain S-box-containing protein [Sulfurimonas sp.]
MLRIILILFLLIFSVFASNQKDVLLLHSYHKGYKWTDDITKSIENKFLTYKDIDLTTIYMDTKRVNNIEYLNSLENLYKEQFKKRKFDLIIVSDNAAYEFIVNNYKGLFENTPVLFCGVNSFNKSFLKNKAIENHISGVVEQVDIEKNFQLIKKLHPTLKKLVIINDKSKTALEIRNDLIPIIDKYKDTMNIEYIDDMDIRDIQKKVANLDRNSVILFLLLFKDKAGKHFTYKQGFLKIKERSKVPIYGLWDFYLGYGLVGGLLTSAVAQGEATSKMAIDILYNNINITQIPILEKSPNRYLFDYKELNKFRINVSKELDNYYTINIPKAFYEKHTESFLIAILVIVILSTIVLAMRENIQRRKKLQKELSNKLKFEKVLLNTLPNPIYYKDKEGKFIGCNEAFCQLLNKDKDFIIGKTAYDFFPFEVAQKNSIIDKTILANKATDRSEFTINFPNEHMKYFIISKSVYSNIDGSVGGIVCILDDISERIQQKQFIIQQSKLAEMGDMVAAIAHQWNEPLVELSAQVQDIQTSSMLNELDKVNIEEFVQESMLQIKYMSKTLSDFRNFLKPSTKKVLFSIRNSFDEIFEIIEKQIFYSNIKMSVNYEDSKSCFLIFGYENEFKQVLLNIINNAKNKIIENRPQMKEDGTIIINISQHHEYSKIEIIDNAGRIDESIIHSIFDPYFTTKKNGTGLGLYMAKVIVEDKMQGEIYVNNDNENVIFTIKMPHDKPQD